MKMFFQICKLIRKKLDCFCLSSRISNDVENKYQTVFKIAGSIAAFGIMIMLLSHGLWIDHVISDLFFKNRQWLWPKQDKVLTFWLHDFIKDTFIVFGIVCGGISIVGNYRGLVALRFPALMIALSLCLVPLAVLQIKAHTHVFCPANLMRYNGAIPDKYQQISLSPALLKKSNCFPASHPSPGFALMILGAIATTRRRRIAGYVIGVLAGTGLSIIQIGRGEHFISHCIATGFVALWIVNVLPYIVRMLFSYKEISWPPVFKRMTVSSS